MSELHGLASNGHEARDEVHLEVADRDARVARMEIEQAEVLALARTGYLLARWHRGQLLIRPGVL